jgi:hypothetical protein
MCARMEGCGRHLSAHLLHFASGVLMLFLELAIVGNANAWVSFHSDI